METKWLTLASLIESSAVNKVAKFAENDNVEVKVITTVDTVILEIAITDSTDEDLVKDIFATYYSIISKSSTYKYIQLSIIIDNTRVLNIEDAEKLSSQHSDEPEEPVQGTDDDTYPYANVLKVLDASEYLDGLIKDSLSED